MQVLVKDGVYSDMLTVLAVSYVVQKPIQMVRLLCIPQECEDNQSPMTKLVVRRDVSTKHHPLMIMRTVST